MYAVYGYEEVEDDEPGVDLGGYVSPFGSASMGSASMGCTDGCTDCGPCGLKKFIPYALIALGAWFLLK